LAAEGAVAVGTFRLRNGVDRRRQMLLERVARVEGTVARLASRDAHATALWKLLQCRAFVSHKGVGLLAPRIIIVCGGNLKVLIQRFLCQENQIAILAFESRIVALCL